MAPKLGIIAGAGRLPGYLLNHCRASGRDCFLFPVEGHADPALAADTPHMWIRLGAAGRTLKRIRDEGIREIVMIGAVSRPTFAELRPDAKAIAILSSIGAGRLAAPGAFGDDGLLKGVISYLEKHEGLRVRGVDEFLPDLQAPPGILGQHAPDAQADADIARGIAVLRALSVADVGQAAAVQGGLVLGVEAIEGTDSLIARCGALRRDGPGPVLVKFRKHGQEHRADLPTIGPVTVENAGAAGFRGIAMEAGGALLPDCAETVAIADRRGLFLVALSEHSTQDAADAASSSVS